MTFNNRESIQLLNTAIIKSKEKKIDSSYEERLNEICNRSAMNALATSVAQLADSEKISRDQAAVQLIDTIKDLESIWNDYVMMEGINNLKSLLKKHTTQ